MQLRHVLIASALLALGCQQSPAPARTGAAPAPAPQTREDETGSPARALMTEGDALTRAGDYRAALARYRQALELDPENVQVRFAIGTAHTFLGQRAKAAEEFNAVVARGDAQSVEVQEARRWLAAARMPLDSGPSSAAPAAPQQSPPAADAPITGGRLIGSTQWPGVDPKVRAVSGEIEIVGVEPATEGVKRSRPLRLGARYHFYDIPPGQYRIVARMANYPADVTLWDQRVSVVEGKPTELDLTPATARLSPDKFPPPVQE